MSCVDHLSNHLQQKGNGMGVMWDAVAKRIETRAPAESTGIGLFLILALIIVCATIIGVTTIIVTHL